jgi:hypothetical protein
MDRNVAGQSKAKTADSLPLFQSVKWRDVDPIGARRLAEYLKIIIF